MDNNFEIIISPNKKWKRMSLLLQSHMIDLENDKNDKNDNNDKNDKEIVEYSFTRYNTFVYEDYPIDLDWYADKPGLCTPFVDDIDDGFLWIKDKVKRSWNVFIETI